MTYPWQQKRRLAWYPARPVQLIKLSTFQSIRSPICTPHYIYSSPSPDGLYLLLCLKYTPSTHMINSYCNYNYNRNWEFIFKVNFSRRSVLKYFFAPVKYVGSLPSSIQSMLCSSLPQHLPEHVIIFCLGICPLPEIVSFWRARIWSYCSLYFQPLEYALDNVSELKQSYYFQSKSGDFICGFS